jgi:hypothetical protein
MGNCSVSPSGFCYSPLAIFHPNRLPIRPNTLHNFAADTCTTAIKSHRI